MAELISCRCTAGKLVITENAIRIDSLVRNQSMPRASLTGLDRKTLTFSFFGIGGRSTLVFKGQGTEVMTAKSVPTKKAKQIVDLLGF